MEQRAWSILGLLLVQASVVAGEALTGCGSSHSGALGDAGQGTPADGSVSSDAQASPDATQDTGTPEEDSAVPTDASEAGEPRDTGTATKPLYDWVGIIGSGQSLSVGVFANDVISTTQPFHNLKLADIDDAGAIPYYPKYPTTEDAAANWQAVPLVEPTRQYACGPNQYKVARCRPADEVGVIDADVPGFSDSQYPNNVVGETPHSGMGNQLSALWAARVDGGDYITTHTVVGWSAHCLVDIDKEGPGLAYPASIQETRVWKSLAEQAKKTFGIGGIILTHGQCDYNNPAYGSGLYTYWQDYNTDLKAITGQTRDVVLLAVQESTAGGYNSSAVQLWQDGRTYPGKIITIGPTYAYQYDSTDNEHLVPPGYLRMGQKYAEVFDLVVNQEVAWKPLGPNAITQSGKTITLTFDVPNPPLVWDESFPPPHQAINTAWKNGRGFEVVSKGPFNANIPVEIESVTISPPNQVVIELTDTPDASAGLTVGYAITEDATEDSGGLLGGLVSGLHGQLRDSDPFVGNDAETIASVVTQGSAAVTSVTPGAFVRRAGRDIVTGPSVPGGAVVLTVDQDPSANFSQLTLTSPWAGSSGTVHLSYHHDQYNWCVHFALPTP